MLYTTILSFISGAVGAWVIMRCGAKLGFNDKPNHRSSHSKSIPKGAGIGILGALIFSSMIIPIAAGFWVPAAAISFISFFGGDKHLLSPKTRLIIHFLCSVVFLTFLADQRELSIGFYLLSLPLSLFIVGTANFYNFMDGIDGIAGITAVIGFSLIALYATIAEIGGDYRLLSLSIAFSCAGFLCFNLPKAKVFLGDIGSVLLGFLFSCLVIAMSENAIDFLVMMGFLSTFYFDELFTMLIRIRNGDSLLIPHRKHIYQILVNEFGICHWKIALLYGMAQLIIGISMIFAEATGIWFILFLYLLYCSIFVLFMMQIHKRGLIKCE